MLAFFFPEAHADIDWARGHEMLDKELQPIVRQAKHGRRYVDKLVKIWLKTGEEKWLLIHIEVQGSKEADFPVRMHVYNHRIFDRYGREVISLAILVDDDPAWRPDRYESARWGFRSLTEFPVVKLLDYAPNYQELVVDPNPFAVVVLGAASSAGDATVVGERAQASGRCGWSRGCMAVGWTRRTCAGCSGSSTGSWSCRSPRNSSSAKRPRQSARRSICFLHGYF